MLAGMWYRNNAALHAERACHKVLSGDRTPTDMTYATQPIVGLFMHDGACLWLNGRGGEAHGFMRREAAAITAWHLPPLPSGACR